MFANLSIQKAKDDYVKDLSMYDYKNYNYTIYPLVFCLQVSMLFYESAVNFILMEFFRHISIDTYRSI